MSTKLLLPTAALAAFAIVGPFATATELIINGSFEEPVVTAAAGFHTLSSIPGWMGGAAGIEVQADGRGRWTASGIAEGEQFVEPDTSQNSYLFQDVPTLPGQEYLLRFAFAPRNGDSRPSDSNDIEVLWEGSRIALLGGPSIPSAFRQEDWNTYEYRVVGNSRSRRSRLQFAASGASDSKGGLIDRVSLVAIPEPGTCLLAGAALLGMLVFKSRAGWCGFRVVGKPSLRDAAGSD